MNGDVRSGLGWEERAVSNREYGSRSMRRSFSRSLPRAGSVISGGCHDATGLRSPRLLEVFQRRVYGQSITVIVGLPG
jgi:hypothetical protein